MVPTDNDDGHDDDQDESIRGWRTVGEVVPTSRDEKHREIRLEIEHTAAVADVGLFMTMLDVL
jgi:hypothetical protein